MKKLIISFIVLLSTSSTFACLGEAQIIAQVSKVGKTMSSCRVFVNPLKIRFFSMNQLCPLDINEVAAKGVEVGLKDGHDCALDVQDDLNGIVFINSYGKIELEK